MTLPKAKRMTPKQFGNQVAKAIADFDPDAASRYRRAREQRSVWTRELEDGMSYLGMVHDTSTITAIKATLDTDAHALRAQRRTAADEVRETAVAAGDDAERAVWASSDRDVVLSAIDDADGVLIGACRADALAARILGTTAETGDIDWQPTPATTQVQLVIDLQTLRGEADRHCLLDGQPVPAEIGRDLAGYATAFRRMVTDPVDGHLLDYGTLTYLPAPLRTYVLARDGGCRAPGCTSRDPRRMQMDHATPFPDGPVRHRQHRRDLHLRPPEQDRRLRAHREQQAATDPATGSPPGANASTSPPDPSSTTPPTTRTPTRHHPSTNHPSDHGQQPCAVARRRASRRAGRLPLRRTRQIR